MAREQINKPDTYERFPKSRQILDCEQQPTHTSGQKALVRCAAQVRPQRHRNRTVELTIRATAKRKEGRCQFYPPAERATQTGTYGWKR
jgi:hypothetical protein